MPATERSRRIAVHTNFLLDLAAENSASWEALETVRQRLRAAIIFVPPTVIDELVVAHDKPEGTKEQRLAAIALRRLRRDWKFQPVDLVPVGHGIVEQIAAKIRERGYLPPEEKTIRSFSRKRRCSIVCSS